MRHKNPHPHHAYLTSHPEYAPRPYHSLIWVLVVYLPVAEVATPTPPSAPPFGDCLAGLKQDQGVLGM